MRIYNSLTRATEAFEPSEPGHVRIYACGMTVYDYCHIGHARAMITFDVVVRWLRERGWRVTFVRNHTDVDDKIIARAQELGVDAVDLARDFIVALDEDLGRLGNAEPDVAPKVSEHIDQVRDLIGRLIERGHAYASGGDVFFSVESFPEYGKLSGKRVSELRSGERIAIDERKRHPADFNLWKAAKPREPAWDSPWGPGRPGWHIECSAMGQHYLGETFDIHGGGLDLIFPHHENEIAQSEAGCGRSPFARVWMHNGMLNLGETKMSKSLGNIVRIRDLLDRVPAEALRLLYLEAHYRSPLPYNEERLSECVAGVERLYTAKETLVAMAALPANESVDQLVGAFGEPAVELVEQARGFREQFTAAMDDDFNTARAIAGLFELARAANRLANNNKARKRSSALAREALAAFDLAGRVLGIGGGDPLAFFTHATDLRLGQLGLARSEVQAKVQARQDARANKDWAAADAARDELAALGVTLMDGPQGTAWRMSLAGE